jgi:hypothetical protein
MSRFTMSRFTTSRFTMSRFPIVSADYKLAPWP